jgi:hypothetical protein
VTKATACADVFDKTVKAPALRCDGVGATTQHLRALRDGLRGVVLLGVRLGLAALGHGVSLVVLGLENGLGGVGAEKYTDNASDRRLDHQSPSSRPTA